MAYRDQLEAGRDAFGHLVRVWHERNGWSQRLLPALAEHLDLGRVHNSQLSKLRNRKLASPGPELFVALGRLNQLLARDCRPGGVAERLRQQLLDQPELLAALEASALPLLDADAQPLGPAELFEIFVGLRPLPSAFDLRIDPAEAAPLSAALAELFTAGRPWRQCRTRLLAAYPVEKRQRRERFSDVVAGQRDYTAAELDAELPDLCQTLMQVAALEEPQLSPDQLLDLLRQKARLHGQPAREDDGRELGSAIRKQILMQLDQPV